MKHVVLPARRQLHHQPVYHLVRFTPPATIWTAEHAGALQRDHDAILDAVRRGDAETASRLTAEHVRHAAAIRDEHPELRASGPEDREDLSGS